MCVSSGVCVPRPPKTPSSQNIQRCMTDTPCFWLCSWTVCLQEIIHRYALSNRIHSFSSRARCCVGEFHVYPCVSSRRQRWHRTMKTIRPYAGRASHNPKWVLKLLDLKTNAVSVGLLWSPLKIIRWMHHPHGYISRRSKKVSPTDMTEAEGKNIERKVTKRLK